MGKQTVEAIIKSLDGFYSDNLGEEVTRGMRESASRGFYLSSSPPYGFHKVKGQDGDKEGTKLEVDAHQASMVGGTGLEPVTSCV